MRRGRHNIRMNIKEIRRQNRKVGIFYNAENILDKFIDHDFQARKISNRILKRPVESVG